MIAGIGADAAKEFGDVAQHMVLPFRQFRMATNVILEKIAPERAILSRQLERLRMDIEVGERLATESSNSSANVM